MKEFNLNGINPTQVNIYEFLRQNRKIKNPPFLTYITSVNSYLMVKLT